MTGESRFPVVGIGASAGGLEAVTQLLSSLAPDTGMAVVLVQHLDPRHESRLPELLTRATRIPVLEATHGLAVLLVENGDDALRSAPGFAPELALIDIGLPGMNGYELARRIRDDPGLRDMTLVAQTGWGQDYDRMRSREAGFDHHLVKPLTTQELGRVLNVSRRGRPA